MANINIFGTLFNAAGTAIVKGEQVEGGYAVVADVAARNAIPLSILKVGSLVYCQSDGKVYKCSAIDGNEVSWVEFETPVPTKLSEFENDTKFVSIAEPINVEGYKQLAYIECTGTQVIDTGFMPNQNTGFELDYTTYLAPTATNSPQVMNAGGRGTNPRLAISLWVKNNLSGEVMVNTTSSTAKMVANSRSLLKYINDGTTKKITYTDRSTLNLTNVSDFNVNDSLILFGLKSGATFDRYFRGRLYNLKLYNLTTLIHNFVPAMRLSDNEVGLLDIADNNTFYTNDGTGTFGYSEEPILNSVSQLIMDRNIVTDNNFTDVYKDQIQQNADDIADIQALLPTLVGLNFEVVNELPTQDISTSTIYLVPKSQSGTNNVYDEYIYVNNVWEKIGDTEIDLSDYVEKEQGKGLSTNDFTDLDKDKLDGIEDGAEENVIESISVNGTAATITNKEVELSVPQQYVYICKNYGGTTSVTITASSHGCGNMPLVQCYMDNAQIDVVVAKNSSGDVTVSWNGIANVSAQNPLTICILGMSVTPVEEQQSVPDASDFPYLTFTKTDNNECSVKAYDSETFAETNVVIPAAVMLNGEELAVTSIGEEAFDSCSSLTSVTIPDSVTSIGDYAFSGCYLLTSVTIPNSVTSIGNYAFDRCFLETLIIGNGVETIGEYAFSESPLTSVTIPNSVTSIGNYAFGECSALETLIIGSGVETIGEYAFTVCSSLTSVTIPDSVTSIGESAFAYCDGMETLIVGSGVETIGSNAFYSCSSLTSVTIPNSVTSIGDYAFSNLDSNAVINCEAASKPAGWDNDWTDCENVVWGATMP